MTTPRWIECEAEAAAVLLALPGIGRSWLTTLFDSYGSPAAALRALHSGDSTAVHPNAEHAKRWRKWLSGPAPARIAATARERGASAILRGRDDWPIRDRVPDEPRVLLAEGERPDALVSARVAVVGTRAATPHGLADAQEIGAVIARAGATVVSGLAIGVDAAAHAGALDAGGLVVGVVATGLDVTYPRRHTTLFERVRAGGVLLSEVAYRSQPERWRFPVRNRIIAALADVVVVVEATARGGARITAEYALEYGRSVLAVPGSRRNPAASGCNELIADGAHPLLDPADVLLALGTTAQPCRPSDAAPPDAESAAIITACAGEPTAPDELCVRSGLDAAVVARAVRRLEGAGLVARRNGLVWPL